MDLTLGRFCRLNTRNWEPAPDVQYGVRSVIAGKTFKQRPEEGRVVLPEYFHNHQATVRYAWVPRRVQVELLFNVLHAECRTVTIVSRGGARRRKVFVVPAEDKAAYTLVII